MASQPEEKEPYRKDAERGGGPRQKLSASSSSAKAKDLSHVPCKFFKVGGCTAGSSCPFSHHVVEPGGQKETCAWFVKGTCKFGHKCALAHILPGQSMSMDRKNKKAAQLAAAASAGEKAERGGGGKDGKGGKIQRRDNAVTNGGRNNALLGTGATAPTRILGPNTSASSVRPPMMKATLSPSAPAPPLASFGVLDDLEGSSAQLATAPAHGKPGSQDDPTCATTSTVTTSTADTTEHSELPKSIPSPVPVTHLATSPTNQRDFGPIGSPPAGNAFNSSRVHANGVLGTSPQHINGIPGSPSRNISPFSAPGTQTTFLPRGSYSGAAGIASSVDALSLMGGRGWGSTEAAGSFSGLTPARGGRRRIFESDDADSKVGITIESAMNDGDLEDFLPSSLTDLLTPEERTRRMSRSHSGQPIPATALGTAGFGDGDGEFSSNAGISAAAHGHRYSRSVPAPSLLGDIRSIWANNSAVPVSPPANAAAPSSPFAARFDSLSTNHAAEEETGLSLSMGSPGSGMASLSPSNASAAFLPGLHSHYLNAKARQAQQTQQLGLGLGGLGRGNLRNTSAPLYNGSSNNTSALSKASLSGSSVHSHSPLPNSAHTFRSPFELTQQQEQHRLQSQTPRPIPSHVSSAGVGGLGGTNQPTEGLDDLHAGTHMVSPSTRALRAHAPGQSLPQGLAAGYSRIHALPPPPVLGSPASSGTGLATPTSHTVSEGVSGEGMGMMTPINALVAGASPGASAIPFNGGWKEGASSPPSNTVAGLDSMFSRLSYSAASSRFGPPGNSAGTTAGGNNGSAVMNTTTSGTGSVSSPGLSRNINGGRYTQPLSPLSGPVVTNNDDDDLFSMDG